MITNSLIAGRYKVEERIGAGGMGMVYKGLDTETQTPVAIKVLKTEAVYSRPDSVERFRREGQALRELNHPNIVTMYDYIEVDNNHYLIEEYLSGGDLRDRLLDSQPLSIKEILNISLDLADALTRAHRLSIIHRDLKPANVLLDDKGLPHLSDFGIALIGGMERVTEKGGAIGTADYMSPEMLRAEEVDVRTDVWSFGVMIFELMTGKRPFTGRSLGQIIAEVMNKPIPDLESMRPDAPVDLVDLVYRMLEKDRQTRIATIRMVGAELEQILRGRSTDPIDLGKFDTGLLQRFDTDDDTNRHHNLPSLTTPFVGRENEIAEIHNLIANPDVRLITILAPGGMGKTRLALEIAQQQLGNYRNGVYFIPLASVDDPSTILSEIAQHIGLQTNPTKQDVQQQLLDYLRDKQMLLIVDNFEHLIDGGDYLLNIMNTAEAITIIVTSRQRLNQSGETVFNLEGMTMPDWDDIDSAMKSSPVQLFLQGARRAQPGYELLPSSLPHIAEICELIQGMPLGILLAASWIEMLTLPEIAKEMQDNLDFLETDLDDIPERQRSLKSVFNYSWNLLTEQEQSVFMKLAIFRGGFTREAAQQITGASLRGLMGLMNKSLIRRNPQTGRYWVHELLRQYAIVKLNSSGERSDVLAKYADYYTNLLTRLNPDLHSDKMATALRMIDADDENVATAWLYWVRHPNWQRMYEMVLPFGRYATTRNRYTERDSLLKLAVDLVDKFPLTHGFQPLSKALYAYYTTSQDTELLEDCIADAEKVGSPHDVAFCQWVTGIAYKLSGKQDAALSYFEQARAIFAQQNLHFEYANVLHSMSESLLADGKLEKALTVINECLKVRRKVKDQRGEWAVMIQLGSIHMVRAEYDLAETYWREARRMITDVLGSPRISPEVSIALTLVLIVQGGLEEAYNIAQEMYAASAEYNIPDYQAYALAMLAVIMVIQAESLMATAYIEEMNKLDVQEFDYWIEADKAWACALVGIATGDLTEAKKWCRETLQVGKDTNGTLMILGIPISALIACHEERYLRATELMSLAWNHPTSAQGWLKQWQQFNDLKDILKEKVSDAFDSMWEQGKSADLITVVDEEIHYFEKHKA